LFVSDDSIAGIGIPSHKPWRRCPFDPPDVAFYGTQKFAKTKRAYLTAVVDKGTLEL
jgi:hypothetical protein